jgi:hypothetical protein
VGRAVTLRSGFVWRPTVAGVLVQPRFGDPFTIDRRAGRVLAALDRARPESVDQTRLLVAVTSAGEALPPNAEAWLDALLALFESVDLIDRSNGDTPR